VEIDLELLRQVFHGEAQEHLSELEGGLLDLESQPDDSEALRRSFRAIHTLKGSAATVGLTRISEFSHGVEDLMDRLRGGQLQASSAVVSLLLEAIDVLRMLLDAPVGPDSASDARAADLSARIAALARSQASAEAADPSVTAHGNGATSTHASKQARGGASLRVGIDKLDRLLDLAGEIVIARSSFQQLLSRIPGRVGERLREAFRESARLTMELQEQVSSVRMVPVGPTLRQFVRIARDLSLGLGKRVRVEIQGEDVEVDAAVIEHLKDPLMHIVRNAIDHGIELPEEREAKGKTPTGRLLLRAFHRAGSIVIESVDDGIGLDRERILSRARARGLVGPDLQLSDIAVFGLIFEEGFSTATQITDLSGRGVGMGVVRKNVESLGGSVRIHGAPNRGTTVALQLPLTLAILEALTVSLAGDTFLIPLSSVVECFDLPTSLQDQRRGWVPRHDSREPWVRLADLLDTSGAPRVGQIVLVQHESRRIGLAVEDIHGTQQIVIKPLNRLFRDLPGVAGCTILHSGRVALILDVKSLIELSDVTEREHRASRRGVVQRAGLAEERHA